MRRLVSLVLMSVMFALPFAVPAQAAVKIGNKCSKLGAISKSNGSTFTCIKSGKTLVWNLNMVSKSPKAVNPSPDVNPIKDSIDKVSVPPGIGKKCDPKKECPMGSLGPGGGIVFYDAKSIQPWGRYLEFSPQGWSGSTSDPWTLWCDDNNNYLTSQVTDSNVKSTLGNLIGQGRANTYLMLTFCRGGAVNFAKDYKGGGKSDWFIPSRDELNELCKFMKTQATGDSNIKCSFSTRVSYGVSAEEAYAVYWSSSEVNARTAYLQNFYTGWQYNSNMDYGKGNEASLRLIRAFS